MKKTPIVTLNEQQKQELALRIKDIVAKGYALATIVVLPQNIVKVRGANNLFVAVACISRGESDVSSEQRIFELFADKQPFEIVMLCETHSITGTLTLESAQFDSETEKLTVKGSRVGGSNPVWYREHHYYQKGALCDFEPKTEKKITIDLTDEQKEKIAKQFLEKAYFWYDGPCTFFVTSKSIKKVEGLDNTFVIIQSREGYFLENLQADKVIAFEVDEQFNAVNMKDVHVEKGYIQIVSAIFRPEDARIVVKGTKIMHDGKNWQGSTEWKKS